MSDARQPSKRPTQYSKSTCPKCGKIAAQKLGQRRREWGQWLEHRTCVLCRAEYDHVVIPILAEALDALYPMTRLF